MVSAGNTSEGRVAVWDVPTRLFHWLFAASFAVAWLTHEHDRYLDVHVIAGYTFIGLLLFRLIWGFVGGRYARFRHFAHHWTVARDYAIATLRGTAPRYLGHNPAGAWAIFTMLGLGLLVSVTGLFTLGGEEGQGVFAGWLTFRAGEVFHDLHETSAIAMLVLVAAHVTGVAFESWRHRENLAAALVTGYKRGPGAHSRTYGHIGVLLMVVVLIATAMQLVDYARATPEKPYVPFTDPALPDNATWRSECGSCHLAFHPTLLPARSWDTLLSDQKNHFGDDLSLEPAVIAELLDFARRHAAESALTEAAWKINRSVPAQDAPLRITETAYWKRKHRAIQGEVWSAPVVRTRANCAACHQDAERGTFEDAAMHLPVLSANPPKSN